jgi:hypothetical protein
MNLSSLLENRLVLFMNKFKKTRRYLYLAEQWDSCDIYKIFEKDKEMKKISIKPIIFDILMYLQIKNQIIKELTLQEFENLIETQYNKVNCEYSYKKNNDIDIYTTTYVKKMTL